MAVGRPLDRSPAAAEEMPAILRGRPRRGSVVLALAVALAIVGATWYVGGRQGFDQLGRGGSNAGLLPKVGQAAPDFAAVLNDGSITALSGFRGRPVWLNFWGSWCPPCRSEMPDLQAAYERLQPRGLVLLAVSLDEPSSAAFDYARLNGATYPVATDPERRLTGGAYPILNFPTHILIDRDGIVRDVVLAELDEEAFVARAEAILGPGTGA